MKTVSRHRSLYIQDSDVPNVRSALLASDQLNHYADKFNGAYLHVLVDQWRDFVAVDWSDWDISEYLHDIVCRDVLQTVLESCSQGSRERITDAIEPYDQMFREKMKVTSNPNAAEFWRTHTLHPELINDSQ